MNNNLPTGILIKQINNKLAKCANNSLRSNDLTIEQMRVLHYLRVSPNYKSTLKEIESFLCVAQSTCVGIISRLKQKELIDTYSSSTDKRIKMACITSHGLECCENSSLIMKEAQDNILCGLDEDEKKLLNTLLLKVTKTMR